MFQRFVEAFNRPQIFRSRADDLVIFAGGVVLLAAAIAAVLGATWLHRRLRRGRQPADQ